MTPRPVNDCDSMCSMSLTVVVRERSDGVVKRLSISSAERPLYCQMALTTGISMSGRISVGIREIAMPPRMAISMAAATKVYGRRSASLTIHMRCLFPVAV